jgi:hypothetical protein
VDDNWTSGRLGLEAARPEVDDRRQSTPYQFKIFHTFGVVMLKRRERRAPGFCFA